VSRRWPHNLAIAVEEYAPAALASLGDLYLVGRTGEPFKRVQAGDVLDLPLITGLTRDDYVADASEVAAQLRSALNLVDAYAQTSYGRSFPLSEVRISEEGYTLVVGKRAQEIHLGEGEIPQKLARLEHVAELLEGRSLGAEVIHLENRVRPAWIAVKLSTPVSERNRGRMK
jgi:cell division protein FtsQ